MTRQDHIEHAARFITELPELEKYRDALYRFYREHSTIYHTGSAISSLLITCLQHYYHFIDIHVSHDDIEFYLWSDEELFKLNELIFEVYQAECAAKFIRE